jgi:hypothetical protein
MPILAKKAFFGQKMPIFGANSMRAPTSSFQTKLSPIVVHIIDIEIPK